MECISIFDMLKIGIGPSSSHTLGPWRAAERWIKELKASGDFDSITNIKVDLYGSLSLTGVGHATDLAIILGLTGADPEYIPVNDIPKITKKVLETHKLCFNNEFDISFNPKVDIVFNKEFLKFHSNGLTFTGTTKDFKIIKDTYYSIGGGFVVEEELTNSKSNTVLHNNFPFPIQTALELSNYCVTENKTSQK